MLRDVDGLSSQEVCEVLEISEANQRVLLAPRAQPPASGAGRRDWWESGDAEAQERAGLSAVVELITDYLEGALSRSQRRRFEAHLADCEHCTEYLEQMRATIRLTGRLQTEDLSREMREEFGALYRRWRSEAG